MSILCRLSRLVPRARNWNSLYVFTSINYQQSCRSANSFGTSKGSYTKEIQKNIVSSKGHEESNHIESDEDDVYDPSLDERIFVDMEVEDFKALYQKNPENEARIKIALLDYENLKYNSAGRVPSVIDLADMKRLLEETATTLERERILYYYFKREVDRLAWQRKKVKKKDQSYNLRASKYALLREKNGSDNRAGLLSDDGKLVYGLWHNSLFIRVPERKFQKYSTKVSLSRAAMEGPTIVFDYDFGEYMKPWLFRNAIDQVQTAYGINRYQYYDDHFDLWFCNLDQKSDHADYLKNNSMINLDTDSMITIKSDCFTNYFDKKRLIYLSPNATKNISTIKADDVFIIGVYNDKLSGSHKPITQKKAEKLGIECRKLPLDMIAWARSSKTLCINHVVGILIESWSNGGNWREALMKHIPSRKIKSIDQIRQEEERRSLKLLMLKKGARLNLRTDLDQ